MIRRLLPALTLSLVVLAGCEAGAESGMAGAWHLVGLDGEAAPAPLLITFEKTGETSGRFSGNAPCNRFFGALTGTKSALSLGPIGATSMACDHLDVEAAYFDALAAVQQSEIDQGHLYLTGPGGRIMEFARDPSEPCLSCLARQ